MKNVYTCLAALLLCAPVFGQYQIANGFHNPAIGDQYSTPIDTMPQIMVGSPGTDVIWDFSSLRIHSRISYDYVDPSTTTYGDEFPDADVAEVTSEFTQYLDLSNGLYKALGISIETEFDSTQIQGFGKYEPHDTILVYPSNYLDSYSDYSEYSFTAPFGQQIQGFQIDSIRETQQRTEQIEFDAYGTMITPRGTYINVLREKISTTIISTQEGYIQFFGWQPAPGSPSTESYTWYNWYAEGIKFPLASALVGDGGQVMEARYNINADPTSLNELTSANVAVQVYPNPAIGRTTVQGTEQGQIIRVYNALGKEVYAQAANDQVTVLTLDELAAGSYLIKLTGNNRAIKTGHLIIR